MKSSITFGDDILEDDMTKIKLILGIKMKSGMESYLGLPESLGWSTTNIFSFVREWLQDCINGWSVIFFI